MKIFGIETSCDETAAAVVEVKDGRFSVLSNVVASQIKIHAKTGGVVPEVAARAHADKIFPVIEQALKESKGILTKTPAAAGNFVKMDGEEIDAIAVTAGPGLMTSLLVGVEVARTLSAIWKKPLIAVNHLAGHVYANWIPPPSSSPTRGEETSEISPPSVGGARGGGRGVVKFPALCLIVSGGHTELVLMRTHLNFKIIGSTRDDAAGEAFDKVAKMLGFPYPGGPAVAVEAAKFFQTPPPPPQSSPIKGEEAKGNSPPLVGGARGGGICFPRPMMDSPNFDFSFSGLKTSVLYYLKNLEKQNHVRPHMILHQDKLQEICYEFERAVVDVLVSKTIRAAKKYNVKTVLLGGGVAANTRLRDQLAVAVERDVPSAVCCMPSAEYTGDNAAMIAAAGYFMARVKQFTPWQKLEVDPNWELGQKIRPIPR